MSIIYVKGDILKAFKLNQIHLLGHGVNCSGGFGSGIAGQIAKEYPIVKREYLQKYKTKGWGLGQIQPVILDSGTIINCATQKLYGRDPMSQPKGRYCSYQAIRESLIEIKGLYNLAQKRTDIKIGIPRIGCGLAGGNWEEVEKIINEIFVSSSIYVYCL